VLKAWISIVHIHVYYFTSPVVIQKRKMVVQLSAFLLQTSRYWSKQSYKPVLEQTAFF